MSNTNNAAGDRLPLLIRGQTCIHYFAESLREVGGPQSQSQELIDMILPTCHLYPQVPRDTSSRRRSRKLVTPKTYVL